MLSIFNMHIQFAWGEYLHFTDPTCPTNSPIFFSSKQFFLTTNSHTYTNVQSLLQTCCAYLLLTQYLNLLKVIKMLTVNMEIHVV